MLKVTIRSFSYGSTEILNNIRFNLDKGSHLAVLGESGCGKSTLLHLIYGLLHLEDGSIHWNNKPLLGPKFNLVPGESFIKLVAQEFNVMPFTTVAENVAEYLGRTDPTGDEARVDELLQVVDLNNFANTKVKLLSGGQKQRVALAKALAEVPELILLDEPFSHIDTFRKNKLRREVFGYLKANKIACITATHDAAEALAYADQLIILKDGRIDVYGPPEAVYNSLQSEYQAGFFDEVSKLPAYLLSKQGKNEDILLFPNMLKVSRNETKLMVKVLKNYFKGSHYLIQASWNDKNVFFEHKTPIFEGKSVFLERKMPISHQKL